MTLKKLPYQIARNAELIFSSGQGGWLTTTKSISNLVSCQARVLAAAGREMLSSGRPPLTWQRDGFRGLMRWREGWISIDLPRQLQSEAAVMAGNNQISEVIAFICGIIVVMLMVMALASTDWLMAAGWRQGLFMHCISDDAPTPLPFNIVADPDCYPARDVAYIKAAAALCVVCLLTDLFATLMAGLGLRSTDHRKKYTYYRVAVYIMILSLISLLLALVIYPVYFASELKEGNRTVWEFGWAYGVGWGAAIFLFGGVILLLCDKESEEIYYKERKIVHDTDSTRA
ncbi:transmembrane protein 47 isoform X2 [Neocloeon triangulifer]|uniref:transmembrane protein 47 isoform X2 n=1 Tax=Neocloeon triangulifer TaxID=2078957 RepID=UPI00286EB9E8|nr:transmembrane protein 47 isoform X2 [Neocloeon triangulifer]